MNQLELALQQAAADITRFGRAWALVGGFAVSARAQPRFTRDVDIAVALVRDLIGCGYSLFSTLEHDSGRLATVRFRRHVGGVGIVVDLLFASSGIEPQRDFNRDRDLVSLLEALIRSG